MNLMLQSDIVEFVVGTRINEAHQDPNVPVELDLRRNIVRRIIAPAREQTPQGMLRAVPVTKQKRRPVAEPPSQPTQPNNQIPF